MKLVKCPRCDLNYIREDEKYCKVCLREMKGEPTNDDMELCSVCNAAPALPGKDVCLSCLKEMQSGGGREEVEDAPFPWTSPHWTQFRQHHGRDHSGN